MSGHSYTINQNNNIGTTQGVHYGDNVSYNITRGGLTRKHIALETQNKRKQTWMESETCDWLLIEKEFKSWEETKTESSFLWLHGRRGCGKSTLLSRIISKISQDIAWKSSDSSRLLYFYVDNDSDQDTDDIYQNILMTFWEQAVKSANGQSADLFGKFPTHQSLEKELHKLLTSSLGEIYIIIDALDQLPPKSRSDLILWLHRLTQKIDDNICGSHLSVAISSRDCKDIDMERMKSLFPVEVTPESNRCDIEKYLKKNLDSDLLSTETGLKDRVFEELRKNADGMFLWASLQATNICNMETKSEVLKTLENLIPPHKMKVMYKGYAEKFESLEGIRGNLARKTIALLAHNAGAMHKNVLFSALSLKRNGKEDQLFDELRKDSNIITRYCNHLVRINENLEVYQFCHGTTFEFFRNYKPDIYNHEVAKLCLYQLSLSELSRGPRNDTSWYNPGSIGSIIQAHPFLPFASSRWAASIKKSFAYEGSLDVHGTDSEVLNILKELLDLNPAVERKQNLQLALQIHFLQLGKTMLSKVSHEHILSFYGFVKLLEAFKKIEWFNPEESDSDGLRPIHWAIQNDMKADSDDVGRFVDKLIEYGVDINSKDNDGSTPLHYAAYHGNTHVVGLLIARKVQIDIPNNDNETALIVACRKHREDIVLALTKAKANVRIHSSFGTALQAISLIGCCKCASAIISCFKRSKITEKDGPFGTSLHAAAFHGHLELVKLLCSKRVKVHATHRTYGTVLTAAATGLNPGLDPTPFLGVVEELVQRGIDINNQEGIVGPALRMAAYHGNLDLVRLLLSKGAKVSKSIGLMGTAYDAAKDRGHQEIMNILLDSDPKAADYITPSTSRPQDQQRVQRIVFKATVKASSIERVDNLITQYEKFVKKEIGKGETLFLRGLVQLGVDCFKDVIALITKIRRNSSINMGDQSHDRSLRIRDAISGLFRLKFPIGITSKIDRSTSEEDRFSGHLPQVLDRMTQGAVKILEDACASEDRGLIKFIADRWIEALNNLVSYPGFGEAILETVVRKRAEELKGHLTNPDLSDVERLEKAKALALVGIELLLAVVEQKTRFGRLSYLISKLWVKAVIDVDDLGREGDAAVQELVNIFTKRLSEAVRTQNQADAEIYTDAGIEFMRAAALSSKTKVWGKLRKEWIIQWELIFESDMEYMVQDLMKRRQREYEKSIKEGRYDEAFGLALASVEVLGAAIRYKRDPMIAVLQSSIQSSIELMQRSHQHNIRTAGQVHDEDLGRIFDAFVSLFGAAEEIKPGHFKGLASAILEYASFPEDGHQEKLLSAIIIERLKDAGRIINPSEREEELVHVYRALFFALEVILDSREPKTALSSSLKKAILEGSIGTQLNFTQMDELECYIRANDYLRAEDDSVLGNG